MNHREPQRFTKQRQPTIPSDHLNVECCPPASPCPSPLEHWLLNIEYWMLNKLPLPPLRFNQAPRPSVAIRGSTLRLFRPSLILLFSFLIALVSAPPATHAASPDYTRTFVDAASAYDDNRLPDAIAGWESLLNHGQVLPEVLFNLGNAYYRHGDLGAAIRAYRHAQTLAPRDPDIRANLGFAAQTAGIALPIRRLPARALLQVSQREWRGIANAAFGLLFLALAAWMAWPRYRFISRPAVAAAALLLALAIAGLWAHRDLRQSPERVVMNPDQKVFSGPLDTSTPLLAIPEGAIVRQLDQRGPWLEVEYDSTRGWLPAATTATVL